MALADDARSIDYATLDRMVRQAAGWLDAHGVRPGDIVGVGLPDQIEHLVAYYAIAHAGAVILPIDCRWQLEEVERVTGHFGASHLLAAVGAWADEGATPGEQRVPGSAETRRLAIGADWLDALVNFPAVQRASDDGDAPAVLSLSSGTTGRPKGPMLSHAQFVARFVFQQKTLGMSASDTYLSATPLYFGAGRGLAMGCLHAGGTVALFPPPYEPAQLVEAVARHRATVLLLVPTLLRRLLDMSASAHEPASSPRFPGLRILVSSGATLHARERREVMRVLAPGFVNYYGSTEGGGVSVLLPEHGEEADGSVGTPIFGTEVQIVDDAHAPLAAGRIGRIRYRSAGTATGFYRDEEASLHAFHDGWYYPGDLGFIDAGGFLHLAGRARDLIIRGGVNIYPDEIEAILLEHPRVSEAAVVGLPSQRLGEEVAAFVVLGAAPEVAGADDRRDLVADILAELASYCRTRMAPYKVPARIELVQSLPRSGTGKVLKTELVASLARTASGDRPREHTSKE